MASWLAAATRTIRELVLFKGSYISRLYGILLGYKMIRLFSDALRIRKDAIYADLTMTAIICLLHHFKIFASGKKYQSAILPKKSNVKICRKTSRICLF